MDGKEHESDPSDRTSADCRCRHDDSHEADPCFPARLTHNVTCKLHRLTDDGGGGDCSGAVEENSSRSSKLEPWPSVRVTFNMPRVAAQRLRRLAQSENPSLRDLGITSVQLNGDQVITLTLNHNNNSSLSVPGTANLLPAGKVTTSPPQSPPLLSSPLSSSPPPQQPDRRAHPVPASAVSDDRASGLSATSRPPPVTCEPLPMSALCSPVSGDRSRDVRHQFSSPTVATESTTTSPNIITNALSTATTSAVVSLQHKHHHHPDCEHEQRSHRPESQSESSKSVCTETSAARYLTRSEFPPSGSSQSYLSPSPAGHRAQQLHSSDPLSAGDDDAVSPIADSDSTSISLTKATVAESTTTSASLPSLSSTSHRQSAIPAISSATPAVPIPSPVPDLPAVVRSHCNTNHVPQVSGDAIDGDLVPYPSVDRRMPDTESLENCSAPLSTPQIVHKEVDADLKGDRKSVECQVVESASDVDDDPVNDCRPMEEEEDDDMADGSTDGQEETSCVKSSAGSSAESPSPDQDSSLKSCTWSSSTTTATVRTQQQSQDSPADSPPSSHRDLRLGCNTPVPQTTSPNDSPLHEPNATSPSHHSDSGIASSASQQDNDPQPVLRQAIDCNNTSPHPNHDVDDDVDDEEEHNSDDSHHLLPAHQHNNKKQRQERLSGSLVDEGSGGSSDYSSSPPVSLSADSGPMSREMGVFKFSNVVPKPVAPVAPGSVVQTTTTATSPIVAHKGEAVPVVAVNGTSHSKCSDDDSSRSSASPPPLRHRSVALKRSADVLSVSQSDGPDSQTIDDNLCFNDGETRTRDPGFVVLPEPSLPTRRLLHSVASGDHNYISVVVDGRDGERNSSSDAAQYQNHRMGNHSGSRLGGATTSSSPPVLNHRIDQNHSDLNTRPNKRRKCSSSTSSDNIHTLGLEPQVRIRSSSGNSSGSGGNNITSGSSNNSANASSRSGDQRVDGQRGSACADSSVDTTSLRASRKFPIMNGRTHV